MRLNPQTYGRAWRKTQESGSPGPECWRATAWS